MKKSLMFMFFLICWFSFFIPCYADNNTGISPESDELQTETKQAETVLYDSKGLVYATGKEYEAVSEALMNDASGVVEWLEKSELNIVPESVTPIYCVDLELLEREREFVLYPLYNGDEQDGRMYMTKLVDKNGLYGGNMLFSLDNGMATMHNCETFSVKDVYEQNTATASPSYADHAERIRKLLGAENVIPSSDVRLVSISYLGKFFYIYNQSYQVLVPIGTVMKGAGEAPQEELTRVLSITDIEKHAEWYINRRNAYLQRKEKWEKEHPGQTYFELGGDMSSDLRNSIKGLVSIDNINDISTYFNIDYSKNWDSSATLGADLKPINEESKAFLPFLFAGIGVLLASGAVVFFVLYKKRKRSQNVEA